LGGLDGKSLSYPPQKTRVVSDAPRVVSDAPRVVSKKKRVVSKNNCTCTVAQENFKKASKRPDGKIRINILYSITQFYFI
jgi:hypothetical protein